uniref:Uncharacterized protein n=1 Tax=Avena sativa TaxID=4498 RepID=A0ACD5VTT5_AVESA
MANANAVPRRLPLHLLEEITDDFSEDRELGSGAYGKVYLGVHKDGQKIAVKILYDSPGHDDTLFDKEFHNLASLQHQHIVRLVGYCHETQRECVQYNGRMVLADVTKRALCLEFMQNGSLDRYLSDESEGHGWHTRYKIIKGICSGLKYLHEELNPPIYHLDLKPANILLDENMIPKIADFGLSRLFGEEKTQITNSPVGTLGYLPPEYINQNIISNKLDIFSLGVVTIKIIAGRTGYSRSAEMSSEQFIDIVHGNWSNRLQATSADLLDSCSEQVKRCIEIALSCLEVDRGKRPTIGDIVNMLNETEILQTYHGALIEQMCMVKVTELIDVQPLQLHFCFWENRLMSCPLHVTNNTDDHDVIVRLVPKFQEGKSYYHNLQSLGGVVPPRSTHTFVVIMKEQQQPPTTMDRLAIVVVSFPVKVEDRLDMDRLFTRAIQENRATYTTVCATTREMMSCEQPIRPAFKVVCPDDAFGKMNSIDVHPTEPWILASSYSAAYSTFVCILNYETQGRMVNLECKRDDGHPSNVSRVRFIARKQLFVVGSNQGYIHVYTCLPPNKVKEFKAHNGLVTWLAVHPTQPFLLSACCDHLIKLWDWDNGWECIRTFNGHSHIVNQVKFNPYDSNTFASVSCDRTAKIWSIFSSNPVTSLDCRPDNQWCVDFFRAAGDQQSYMVTASWDGTAQIWDTQTETCVREINGLQHCRDNVAVIDCLRDHPVLVTVRPGHVVSLCDSTTYRSESTTQFGLGYVQSFAYLKGIRSLAIGHENGIAIMEIPTAPKTIDALWSDDKLLLRPDRPGASE